jgi:hypothetical protein
MAKFEEYWLGTVLMYVTEPPNGCIPPEPRNMAYIDYLAWVDDGNVPDMFATDLSGMEKVPLETRPGELPRPA